MPLKLLQKRLGGAFSLIYLGLVLSALLASLVCYLLSLPVKHIRYQAHIEHSFTSLHQLSERWLAEGNNINQLHQLLELPVEVQSFHEDIFSNYQLKRFSENRPWLLDTHPQNTRLLVRYPSHPDRLVLFTFTQPLEQQLRATSQLLQYFLERTPASSLDSLQPLLHLPARLIRQLPRALDQQQLAQLQAGYPVLVRQQQLFTLYQPLTENTWLVIGPAQSFTAYPPPVVAGLMVVFFCTLALWVGLLLGNVEQRFRVLSRVLQQLAAGNLNSRIKPQRLDFIGNMAGAFNRMADQMQRALSTQQEMIRAVSHELRTPVARIRFGLQMIEDVVDEQPELLQQIQGIDQDIDELDVLIDEILTYARLGQDRLLLMFSRQEVFPLVNNLVVNFQRTNPHLKLQCKVHNPKGFDQTGDLEARYFQRAVQNLIGNAVRYAKTQVRVTCLFENDTFRVDVEDDGAGIPEKDLQRIFAPFTRLDDSRTRSSGGYGLGLSIVQRIVYWHRGSALADRSPALGGARFTLIFPRYQSEDQQPLSAPPP